MQISDPKTIQTFYQALLDRDQSYVGSFYVGVKTTSVFCIANCRARKPKLENVVFYTELKDALDHGFRPCKICKPTENAETVPEAVEKAIQLVQTHPKEKITDQRLLEAGLRPDSIRRWFKAHYGMTFHAYQRMYRVNMAYQELREGKKTTATAFDTAYESLSGFGYTYKKVLGKSPRKSLDQAPIILSRLTTPIGPMFVCATDKGICLLEFVDRKSLETEFKELQQLLKAHIIAGDHPHIKQLKRELEEYFAGKRTSFDVALHFPGTEFQQMVWQALVHIPQGDTINYQALAEQLGKPSATRAVAAANGRNRISILVPCHRVIGKNGHLTGYGGGLQRKRWLLKHEGVVLMT
ncbi:MAG: methylated-DNA--[protein]-cysteine S-methyltransferase [Bacteroidota bacterium]